jgi:antitoxin VapB
VTLSIRDPHVIALANELMQRVGAKSQTDAVRLALEHALERDSRAKLASEKVSLADRVRKYQRAIAALGSSDPDYDHKTHMDKGWEL